MKTLGSCFVLKTGVVFVEISFILKTTLLKFGQRHNDIYDNYIAGDSHMQLMVMRPVCLVVLVLMEVV